MAQMQIKNQEKYDSAHSWLDKAVKMEADGKPPGLVNRALEKACELEKEAFAG
jgi:hypothetical protein